MTSLATGASQPLSLAPAVASVITTADIEAIGANDIDDVLETIPGLHVSRSAHSYSPVYIIRGIYAQNSSQVLVLINGIPITNVFFGDRNQVWGGMPVRNISRIEVVRGPGSALYGADAFAGTINIITKSAREINGTQLGAAISSADSSSSWLLHGRRSNGVELALSLQYSNNNGQGGLIEADAQSALDASLGTSASNAPGHASIQGENIDARVDLTRGDWQLRLGYQGRKNIGNGAGIGFSLDLEGKSSSDRFNADLTYRNQHSYDNWDLNAQLSYFDTSVIARLFLSPAGARFPNGALFPPGVIGNPEVFERHIRLGGSAFYHGFSHHRIRIGAGINLNEVDKIRESKNFIIDENLLPAPINDNISLVDTSNNPDLVFHRPSSRTNFYSFVQDEWAFARDWNLTSGLRWDHYSDFAGTLNPRIALVWHAAYNVTAKLLYGRAFRAPSFAELRNINNPVVLGNPDLEPEIIDTLEWALNYQPTQSIAAKLNLFYYQWRDIIRFVPDSSGVSTAQNTGDQTGYGLEWETDWQFSPTLALLGNYAFQHSTDKSTNSDAANAPQHQIYLRSNWMFTDNWWLSMQMNWVAGRQRAAGDPRENIDDFIWLDLGLRHKLQQLPLTITLAVRNALDQDARAPSLNGDPAPPIPNDLPLAGIHCLLSVEYRI